MMKTALLALACGAASAQTPPDSPASYSHAIALTVSGKNAVVQLRLPPAAYLNSRSATLADLRIFDAAGAALPFALLQPAAQSQALRRQLPVKVFPVGLAPGDTRDVRNDVEIKTSADGSVTSISTRHAVSGKGEAGGALVLDIGAAHGSQPAPVDALVFTLPDSVTNYQAQVELEVSDDLRQWETLGYANLSWLANSNRDTLTNNRMEFGARAFRYARLSWRQGKPLQFAAIVAESPESVELAAPLDSLSVDGHAGRIAGDLVYDTAVALPVSRLGVRFGAHNAVLPALVGHYVELPSAQGTNSTRWEFSARMQTTFFQIDQDGRQRGSADIAVGEVHAPNWVIRPQAALADTPRLRLSWTPATLVFLSSGKAPYTLRVGRADARPMQRDVGKVAPGFSNAELRGLEQAAAGPVQAGPARAEAASAAAAAASAAHKRKLALWVVLLFGVGVLAFMATKLIGQMKKPE